MFNKMFILKNLFFILLCIFNLNISALQIKNLENNQAATCRICKNNKTRIFVENDRIASLRGTAGAYFYTNDEVNGEVYITPTEEFKNKNFSLFITTENHRTFGLKVMPQNILTETIMLKPISVDTEKAEFWEKSGTYNETIVNLLRAMLNNCVPDGYAVSDIECAPQVCFRNLKIRLKTLYTGVNLQGRIYQIKNINACPIKITESIFYKPGVLAVSTQKHNLDIGETSLIYVVSKNG